MAKIIYNMPAYRRIRHLHAEYVKKKADELAEACGPGYKVTLQNRSNTQRPRAFVGPETPEARADDAKNSTLMKAVNQMRGK